MFSPDGTLISASAAPHCGGKEEEEEDEEVERIRMAEMSETEFSGVGETRKSFII